MKIAVTISKEPKLRHSNTQRYWVWHHRKQIHPVNIHIWEARTSECFGKFLPHIFKKKSISQTCVCISPFLSFGAWVRKVLYRWLTGWWQRRTKVNSKTVWDQCMREIKVVSKCNDKTNQIKALIKSKAEGVQLSFTLTFKPAVTDYLWQLGGSRLRTQH